MNTPCRDDPPDHKPGHAGPRRDASVGRGQSAFPSEVDAYRRLLREQFGYPELRDGQGAVLERLSASDVLAVMPTGSGKSMCYILPALVVGRAIVVSPLIALMQDQVESLRAAGVAATFINSSLDRSEQNQRYLDFIGGRLDLLYVAPERFVNEKFVAGLKRAGVNLLAVDEAHCVSEWGHDFRPDYLTLGSVRERLGSPRTLLLTATAEPRVQRDIISCLGLAGEAATVVTSVDRPNLKLSVVPLSGENARIEWLQSYLKDRAGQAGIVYARTRRSVEGIAADLQEAGVRAAGYHAGMPTGVRTGVQRRFTVDETSVIVATTAFGLGIDKPDVRFVVHFNMPGRIESYYQEAGRAGRDGDPADCTLLYDPRDASAQERFIAMAHPSVEAVRAAWRKMVEEHRDGQGDTAGMSGVLGPDVEGFASILAALRASELVDPSGRRLISLDPEAAIDVTSIEEHRQYARERLRQMVEYAESTGCRRAMILRYFGEDASPGCDTCDNCLGEAVSASVEYPYDLHAEIVRLRGELAQRFRRAPYQIFEARTARELATYRPRDPDELLAVWGIGQVKADWFGSPVLQLISDWEEANPGAEERQRPPLKRRLPVAADDPEVAPDDDLYVRLRSWRLRRSQRDGVPAFVVFADRTLRSIAAARPRDLAELAGIWGLGGMKVNRYGSEVLDIVAGRDDHG